jgi:hypothetical protein
VQEQDEAMHKKTRLQKEGKEVYKNFSQVPMEVDTLLDEKVTKISEAIEGFHAKMFDLEAHTMPSTPPKERE